jgi:hypothetical protein
MSPSLEKVAALRAKLWESGFRPLAVLNHDHPNKTIAGKAPIGNDWPNRARQNPPECTTLPPVSHAQNTGILCDGLRAIDIDIDDRECASRCCGIIVGRFGEAPVRIRSNSSRCLILYRAAVGEPPKVVLAGTHGKIEVLGKGQQFVAYGMHPSGVELEWLPEGPGVETLDSLISITEDELLDILRECAPVIGAPPPEKLNGHDHASAAEPQADPLRLAAALNAIPNCGPANWEEWNRVGMAMWRATGGSEAGWIALDAWSRRNPSYDATATRQRWEHYEASPPTNIGAGTIFHLAREAAERSNRSDHDGDTKQEQATAPRPSHPLPSFFDPWSDPPPAEFPGGVLSREMEDTVFATALRNGFCPGVLAMAYLAAASGASSKASRFSPYTNSTWWVPPIIWVMPIADSGQRKTAIEDTAFAALREVHGEIWRQHRDAIRSWRAIPSQERKTTPKPLEPHSFIVEDTGVEKLQIILSENDRGSAMIKDEIAGLFEFGRYTSGKGAAERAYILQTYEGGTYTVSRVGRDSIHIAVNGITLYGAIQPDRLKDFKDLDKDGLLQRINMVRASATTPSRDDIVIRGSDKIYNKIEALTRMDSLRYTTTPEGSALIHETEKLGQKLASMSDFGVGFQGTCSKLHGTHARYSLVLHLLDDPTQLVIPTETIRRAGMLVNEFILPQARDFFSCLTGAPQQRLRNIAGWILTKAPNRFLASDVTTGVWGCRGLGTKDVGDALDPLVSGGWLEPEAPFPSNRAWTLHPRVRDAFVERTEAERARSEEVRQMFSQIGRKSQ